MKTYLINIEPTMNYHVNYNFRSEKWWPKFERLMQKFNIVIVSQTKPQQKAQNNAAQKYNSTVPKNYNTSNQQQVNNNSYGNSIKPAVGVSEIFKI